MRVMNFKILIILLFSFIVVNGSAQYSGGKGTEINPYLVTSKVDMEMLSSLVNSGISFNGTYFQLTQDLTGLNDTVSTIIGTYSSYPGIPTFPFMGIFDGNGHEISVNIKVNENNMREGVLGAGIFGYSSGATIKNLKVSGKISFETALNDCSFNFYGGGICGYAVGTTITNCYNKCSIIAYSSSCSHFLNNNNCKFYIGGICGYQTSSMISCCYSSGDISSLFSPSTESIYLPSYTHYYTYSGGICGFMDTQVAGQDVTIDNCYNIGKISSETEIPVLIGIGTGAYSGGICGGGKVSLDKYGVNHTTIIRSYNIGDISAFSISPDTFSPFCGGICGSGCTVGSCFVSNCQIKNNLASNMGRIYGDNDFYYVSVKNCYSDNSVLLNGTTSSNTNSDQKNGKDAMIADFQRLSWLQSTLGWDFNTIWDILGAGKFPELQMQYNILSGLPEINSIKISIYPNPAKDEIFIKSELQIKKIEIYSATGALLLSDNNFNGRMSISSLLKGIYLVKVYTDNGITVSKIMKE